jgi:hypothetical protein
MTAPYIKQVFVVPNVGAGAGPFASIWFPNRLKKIRRVGLSVAASQADKVALIGAANPNDPIGELAVNPNQLGTFLGGDGSRNATLQGAILAEKYFAFLRYPPDPSLAAKGILPTAGLTFEFQGEGNGLSPTAFAWQLTMSAAAVSCAPPAWQAGNSYTVLGTVVTFPNGAYGQLTTAGISGATAPAPWYYQTGLVDGAAQWTVTGEDGFMNGFTFVNNTGANIYTSGSPGLTPTTGLIIPANGGQQPPTQPAATYVYGNAETVVSFEAWP